MTGQSDRPREEPQTDVFMAVADTLGYVVKNNIEDYSAGVPNDLDRIVGAYRRGGDAPMARISLEIADHLLHAARGVAARDNISVDQLFALAIAEKLSALETAELLLGHAEQADLERYRVVLDLVPDAAPLPGDELDGKPAGSSGKQAQLLTQSDGL